MNKLIICYIGQDVEDFLPLSLDSIKDVANAIVFVDGGSKDKTLEIFEKSSTHGVIGFGNGAEKLDNDEFTNQDRIIINRQYEHDYKGANGRARNCYLDFIKKHFKDWWCLVLDPDEIVDERFPEFVKGLKEGKIPDNIDIASIHMRHLIRSFRHEDNEVPIHFVPNRLFKIRDDFYYEEIEHPVLKAKEPFIHTFCNLFTIWHLAHIKEMFALKKKYDNHRQKSTIHTQQYLRWWYSSHLLGKYPVKEFDPIELPKIIKDYFEIINDELYFESRKELELKHIVDIWQWKQFFNLTSDKLILDVGCGAGHRVLAGLQSGLNIWGFDKSQYLIQYPVYSDLIKVFPEPSRLTYGDIVAPIINKLIPKKYDFIICYDILEHLTYEDLEKAIMHLIQLGVDKAKYLVSVPVKSDPNCGRDSTHIIKEDAEWWINIFKSQGFNHLPTPNWFNFAHQIIVLEKK